MSVMKDFRDFALKGNVLDMTIGLIIGAEFGKIVNSMVADVIMPPIGILLGGVNFKDLFVTLKDGSKAPGPYATLVDAQTAGAVTMNIGNFITTAISFTIIAFCVFLIVKFMNKFKKPAPTA